MKVHVKIKPGQKLDLDLTEAERTHILNDLICLDDDLEAIVRNTPPGQPIKMTLDDLNDLSGSVAAEANHTKNKKLEKNLDRIFGKITALLEKYPEVSPLATVKIEDTKKSQMIAEPAADALPTEPKAKKATKKTKPKVKPLYQFKITLLGSKPPIWRRIQVTDCTLDKLHEHIQTAMGWENSHLHQFEIAGHRYGDPQLLGGMDNDFKNSLKTKLSDILPAKGKRFRFKYEYDFGDGWLHEVLFEGCPDPEKGKKYPLCLEGERACPPEDCGGIWGYCDMLAALADPKHEQHDDFMESIGEIDPEKFDASKATKEMKKGLPDWRSMR